MRRVAFAVAGLVMIGAGPALAQYAYPPRPMMMVGPMPPEHVFNIVRSMGLEPVGAPMQSGHVYVQRAADYYGKPMRVVVDAHRGQVVAVEALGAPGSIHNGPYAAASGPYGRRFYPAYGANPVDDDDEFDDMPQRPQMYPQPPRTGSLHPPMSAQPQRPATKSATITPQRPPVPRKRPASAPQEAAGTVEPLAPLLQNTPAPSAAPAAKPVAPALPPVAPLD